MISLALPRINLVSLDESQLRLAISHPAQLAEELRCVMDPEAISEASQRAIRVKLEKMEQAQVHTHPWYTYWLLILNEALVGVGVVGFKGTPGKDGEVEIGYGISPAYQNHGYMSEAVQGLARWAFLQPGCTSIRAETLRSNVPSHRVLQKAGFEVFRETQVEYFWRIRKATGMRGNDDRKSLAAETAEN